MPCDKLKIPTTNVDGTCASSIREQTSITSVDTMYAIGAHDTHVHVGTTEVSERVSAFVEMASYNEMIEIFQ